MPKALWILFVPLLLSACSSGQEPPPFSPDTPATAPTVEVTFSGVGSGALRASARLRSGGLRTQGLSVGCTEFNNVPQSEQTFTLEGSRYLSATFFFASSNVNCTRANYSLLAITNANALVGTAITALKKYDGSAANAAIARTVMPVNALRFNGVAASVPNESASFQAWSQSELNTLPVSAGDTKLGYGFVSRSSTLNYVTIAYKLPLQATRAQDPYSITFQYKVATDTSTSVTESLEEQGAGSGAVTRANSLSATTINVFPNTSLTDARTRALCAVRTAAAVAAPDDQDVYLYAPLSTGCTQ